MKTLEFTLHGALRQMLDESQLPNETIAQKTETSKGSVSNYARGRTVPKWSVVKVWAETCEYDPEDPLLRVLWENAKRTAPKRGGAVKRGGSCAPSDSNREPADYRRRARTGWKYGTYPAAA